MDDDTGDFIKSIDNTVEMRTFQVLVYQGKIVTLEEYMRLLVHKMIKEKEMDKKIRNIEKKIKKDN